MLGLVACGSSTNNNDLDGGSDSGTDAGPGEAWKAFDVDTTSSHNQLSSIPQLAIAVRSDDTVGMAWFEPTFIDDLSKQQYALKYAAFSGGQLGDAETVRDGLIDLYGVNLTFGMDGQPIVTYLGGDQDTSPENGGATYWFQGDCAVSYRSSAGGWTEQLCATMSNDVPWGTPVDDNGDVVGLFPSVGVAQDGTTYVAYRDVHFGQSPSGDFGKSDWELSIGGPTTWAHQMIQAGGDNGKSYGGHSQMVMVDDQPAMICDQMPNTANGPGSNVLFEKRLADGGWAGPTSPVLTIPNLQSGASLAYDGQLGFAVAAVNKDQNQLVFTQSSDGVAQWTTPDPVAQSGTTGWYPSMAVSPITHDPSIAYYHCSTNPGVAEGSCPAAQDELRIAERVVGNWNVSTVDTDGAFQPKLAFLSTGKRVILFRHPKTGVVRLRVEQ
jgi:hypothetical protein